MKLAIATVFAAAAAEKKVSEKKTQKMLEKKARKMNETFSFLLRKSHFSNFDEIP